MMSIEKPSFDDAKRFLSLLNAEARLAVVPAGPGGGAVSGVSLTQ
jgi:hypothetical protein